MKKFMMSLALLGLLLIPAQGAFAWEYNGISSLNPMPVISKLNPLPYFGIGQNTTNFSLNPFTGFKNCNKCVKADPCNPCKKVEKCNECVKPKCNTCTGAAAPICPSCQKAFPDKPCPCNKQHYRY